MSIISEDVKWLKECCHLCRCVASPTRFRYRRALHDKTMSATQPLLLRGSHLRTSTRHPANVRGPLCLGNQSPGGMTLRPNSPNVFGLYRMPYKPLTPLASSYFPHSCTHHHHLCLSTPPTTATLLVFLIATSRRHVLLTRILVGLIMLLMQCLTIHRQQLPNHRSANCKNAS